MAVVKCEITVTSEEEYEVLLNLIEEFMCESTELDGIEIRRLDSEES